MSAHALHAIVAALRVAALAGCASPPFTSASVSTRPTRPRTITMRAAATRWRSPLSGGATRAAAFSFGVLEALRRTMLSRPPPHQMLDEVGTIMGISGGSFTALSYAVDGGVSDNLGLRGGVESTEVIEHKATFRELVGVNRLRRLAIVIVTARAEPPSDWDRSESGPGIVGQLLKASGVPIAR